MVQELKKIFFIFFKKNPEIVSIFALRKIMQS